MRSVLLLLLVAACERDPKPPACKRVSFELRFVDDDAAYMRDAIARRDPRGPVQAELGIEPPFIYTRERAPLAAYLATLGPVPADHELVIDEVPVLNGQLHTPFFRARYLARRPIITGEHITNVHLPDDGELVYVFLTPTGHARATDAKKSGRPIATIVDGEVEQGGIDELSKQRSPWVVRVKDANALAAKLCATASASAR